MAAVDDVFATFFNDLLNNPNTPEAVKDAIRAIQVLEGAGQNIDFVREATNQNDIRIIVENVFAELRESVPGFTRAVGGPSTKFTDEELESLIRDAIAIQDKLTPVVGNRIPANDQPIFARAQRDVIFETLRRLFPSSGRQFRGATTGPIGPDDAAGFVDAFGPVVPLPRRRSRGSTGGPVPLRERLRGFGAGSMGGGAGEAFPFGDLEDDLAPAGVAIDEVNEALGRAERSAGGLGKEMVLLGTRGEEVATRLAGGDGGFAGLPEVFDAGARNAEKFGDVLGDLEGIGARAFAGLEGALTKFIRTGKLEWRDLANVAIQAIRDIVEAQVNAAGASSSGDGFLDVLRGIFGGGGGGLFGSGGGTFVSATLGPQFTGTGGLGLLSSGSFAHGGRPPVGVPVLVGEQGPELFVPPGPGEIIPNDALGGFGGAGEPNIVVTYNIDARGAELGVEQRLRRMLAEHQRDTVKRTMGAIFRDAQRGGMMSRLSRR